MSIVRTHRKKRNFSTLDNSAPNDIALSYRAKGVLWYLLTKPEDWTVRMTDIVKHSPKEGRDAVKAAFKELEEHGYAIRKKTKNKKGHFDWETNIFETKEDAQEWISDHNGFAVDGSPVDGLPVDGSPVDGKMAHIVNKELQKTDKQKTDLKKDVHTKANSISGDESPSTGSAAGSPSDSLPGEEGRSKNSGTTPLPPSTRKSAPSFADHAESGRSFKSASARMDDYYSGKTKPRKSAKWLDGDGFFQPFVDYLAKRYTKTPEAERRSKAVSALQWAMSNRPDAAPAKAAMNEHWNCFKAQYDAEKNAPALPTDGFEFSSELARSNNFWNTQDGKALLDKLRPYTSEVVIGSYTFPLRQVNLDRNDVPYIAKLEQGQWCIRRKHPVIKEVA